ncbi:hypothetical protein TgHK011_001515 [Trichoderma gracile]|nr:hypothetical protein TgHK011_001515 [Trichoderma gracile]
MPKQAANTSANADPSSQPPARAWAAQRLHPPEEAEYRRLARCSGGLERCRRTEMDRTLHPPQSRGDPWIPGFEVRSVSSIS